MKVKRKTYNYTISSHCYKSGHFLFKLIQLNFLELEPHGQHVSTVKEFNSFNGNNKNDATAWNIKNRTANDEKNIEYFVEYKVRTNYNLMYV